MKSIRMGCYYVAGLTTMNPQMASVMLMGRVTVWMETQMWRVTGQLKCY